MAASICFLFFIFSGVTFLYRPLLKDDATTTLIPFKKISLPNETAFHERFNYISRLRCFFSCGLLFSSSSATHDAFLFNKTREYFDTRVCYNVNLKGSHFCFSLYFIFFLTVILKKFTKKIFFINFFL